MNKQMNLRVADAIRKDWGKFLEVTHGSLMMVFLTKIPQALLPYPKEAIEEALDVVVNHLASAGNYEAVKIIESTKSFLELYAEDKEALESAAEMFKDKNYLKSILPRLSKRQKELLTDLQTKFNE